MEHIPAFVEVPAFGVSSFCVLTLTLQIFEVTRGLFTCMMNKFQCNYFLKTIDCSFHCFIFIQIDLALIVNVIMLIDFFSKLKTHKAHQQFCCNCLCHRVCDIALKSSHGTFQQFYDRIFVSCVSYQWIFLLVLFVTDTVLSG